MGRRAVVAAVAVGVLFGVSAPSCSGHSLSEKCNTTSLTGQEVFDGMPTPTSGAARYAADTLPPTTYTLTTEYHGGSIECYASETHEGCTGPYTDPAHTTVNALVTFRTADGSFNEVLIAATIDRTAGSSVVSLEARTSAIKGSFRPECAVPGATLELIIKGKGDGSKFAGSAVIECRTAKSFGSTTVNLEVQ